MNYFLKFLWLSSLDFFVNKAGAVAPIVALALPVILGVIGLGTDASMWMVHKRNLQLSADSAVLAAGWEIAKDSPEQMVDAALREAERNGYDDSANGDVTVEIISQEEDSLVVRATISQESSAYFSRILFGEPVQITVSADAYVSDFGGKFCILGLNEEDRGAVTVRGAAELVSPDCGVAVNSSDDEALDLIGNAKADVGAVQIVGGYGEGGSTDFSYTSLKTGVGALADPYEDLEVPAHSCSGHSSALNVTSAATLTPGTYCGGLHISGTGDVYFESGTYIIDGGDFDVLGQGVLYGEDVTFVLTGSGNKYAQVDISGGREVHITAPSEGDFAGIAFFQDRDAPNRSGQKNQITGTSEVYVDGVMYFPSQELWFGGNSNTTGSDDPCTKLIADTVTLTGNPLLANNCDGKGVEDLGNPTVRLIH